MLHVTITIKYSNNAGLIEYVDLKGTIDDKKYHKMHHNHQNNILMKPYQILKDLKKLGHFEKLLGISDVKVFDSVTKQ